MQIFILKSNTRRNSSVSFVSLTWVASSSLYEALFTKAQVNKHQITVHQKLDNSGAINRSLLLMATGI